WMLLAGSSMARAHAVASTHQRECHRCPQQRLEGAMPARAQPATGVVLRTFALPRSPRLNHGNSRLLRACQRDVHGERGSGIFLPPESHGAMITVEQPRRSLKRSDSHRVMLLERASHWLPQRMVL